MTGHHTPTTGGTVFLLPGQGCQYPGMARTLYHHPRWTVFRDALDQACHALDPHLDTPLREVMFAEPGTPHATLLTRTDYTQPALFALTTALYHQITHLGPTPTHLIGHSIGEITAAHLTGTLTLQDAALLITTRGRLMHTLPTHTTGMLATHTTHNHLQTLLADHPGITIAAHNSPTDHVLAGDLPTLTHLHHHLKTHNIPTRLLNTSHAFHSPHMDPVLDDFHTTAATLTYHPPTTPVISTLTTTVVEKFTPEHFTRHLREPVHFHQALTHTTTHTTTYLELTPHPTLTPHIPTHTTHTTDPTDTPDTTDTTKTCITHTLHRDHDDHHAFHTALAHLHTHHHTITWPTTTPTPHQPHLPTYPFERHSYWLTPPQTAAPPGQTPPPPGGGGGRPPPPPPPPPPRPPPPPPLP
ncbi:acyltransferase domain-containing protein, partial [Streptomyces sp. NPDC058964]|uniref:acyltransferase domain-containing protein n=1 Tax=Streptomyces sp. NPDC058964 TaxID=3346681 RepID=UPI0036CCAF74